VLVVLLRTICALAQNAPVSPDRPWHTAAEFNLEDVGNIQESRFQIDSSRTYSLAELIDLAETHNPGNPRFLGTRPRSSCELGHIAQ
jgi:hypothetical protein